MNFEDRINKARMLLTKSERPVFIFDDDCDGIASFLMCYKFTGKGTPIVIKSSPNLTSKYASTINSFNPDLLVVLDIALVQEEAISLINCDILWIDHHEVQETNSKITYINPQMEGNEYPTSLAVYNIVKSNLWLCAAGCISDYYYPEDIISALRKEANELLSNKEGIDEIHYSTKLGIIIDILSFSMKGTVKDALGYIKALMKIDSYDELLSENHKSKRLIKHYNSVKKIYDELKSDSIISFEKQDELVKVFLYDSDGWSLTHELSSELAAHYPTNVIVVGRPYGGRMLFSLRSRNHEIKSHLEKSLVSFDGNGGGHPNACGANVLKEDTELFIKQFRQSFENH